MTKEQAIEVLKQRECCRECVVVGGDCHACDKAFEMAIKALEQQTNDCMIFGTKENCFGGATENECEHCDYKIQKLEQQLCEDCVSRQAVDKLCIRYLKTPTDENVRFYEEFCSLPSVTPTHGTCKDCTNYVVGVLDEEICIRGHELIYKDFYCADFKKRGNEE